MTLADTKKGSIVIYGIQASGKGTQAAALSRILGLPWVGAGDCLRALAREDSELGRQVKEIVDSGKIAPDEITKRIMFEKLPQVGISEGFTRTLDQSMYLDSIRPIRAVIHLTLPEPEIYRRVAERAEREGRADDTPEKLAFRISNHHERAPTVLEHYQAKGLLIHIDGDQPINKVTRDILVALGEPIPKELEE